MKSNRIKKSTQYLVIAIAGVILIIAGIIILIQAIGEKNTSRIIIRSVLIFFWVFFTVSNFFIFKKQKQKERMNE
jgi:hypothetical protein